MHTGPREWDAETYHRVSEPQFHWGLEVLERLTLEGDEYVLDAGCGSGRVTATLLERLPDGRVIAVDGSEEMIEKAREVLGDRADVPVTATSQSSSSTSRSTLIFSNAIFHWIPDHEQPLLAASRGARGPAAGWSPSAAAGGTSPSTPR